MEKEFQAKKKEVEKKEAELNAAMDAAKKELLKQLNEWKDKCNKSLSKITGLEDAHKAQIEKMLADHLEETTAKDQKIASSKEQYEKQITSIIEKATRDKDDIIKDHGRLLAIKDTIIQDKSKLAKELKESWKEMKDQIDGKDQQIFNLTKKVDGAYWRIALLTSELTKQVAIKFQVCFISIFLK
jgi:hypothetical protein